MPIETYRFNYMCKPKDSGEIYCLDPAPGLTVGGENIKSVAITFSPPGIATKIFMAFRSESFTQIKIAIIGKYPKLKCSTSEVQNRFNAKYINEQCILKSKNEEIFVTRFSENLDTGAVFIRSAAATFKAKEEEMAHAKDI